MIFPKTQKLNRLNTSNEPKIKMVHNLACKSRYWN